MEVVNEKLMLAYSLEYDLAYEGIYNNVVTDGDYTFQSFCLEEDKEKVLQGLKLIDESMEASQTQIWCNDAFYRYLSGESHQ